MDFRGYTSVRIKLNELMQALAECKTVSDRDGGNFDMSRDSLKNLLLKCEDWLDVSEDFCEQIKQKKHILIKSRAKRLENEPSDQERQ